MIRRLLLCAGLCCAGCAPAAAERDAATADATTTDTARNRFAGRWVMTPTARTPGTFVLIFTSEQQGTLTIYIDDCSQTLSSEVAFTMERTDASPDEFIVNVGPCEPYPSRCRPGMTTPTCERLVGVPFVSGELHRLTVSADGLAVRSPTTDFLFRRGL